MMTDARVDFYLADAVAESARQRATRCGTAAAALAEAEKERAALPLRSKSRAVIRLRQEITSLRDMVRTEQDAAHEERAKAQAKRVKRAALVGKLLAAIAADEGAEERLLAGALADVFLHNQGVDWPRLLGAARQMDGTDAGTILAVAIEAADAEAARYEAKHNWTEMNRHAADAALLADCRDGLTYK